VVPVSKAAWIAAVSFVAPSPFAPYARTSVPVELVGVGVNVATGVGAAVRAGVGETVARGVDVGVDVGAAVGVGVADGATLTADTIVNPADAVTDPLDLLLPLPPVGADVAATRWVPTLAPAGTENVALNVPFPLACTAGMPV
jgi:hypothetical protein